MTGGFGRWLNPAGRWDWWELGGRFDGTITGRVGRAARHRSNISSGPSKGRALLEHLEDSIGSALGQAPIEEMDVAADDNVEMVAKLRDDLIRDAVEILPGAVLLPPGSADDALRWIDNWPKISPVETLALLDTSPDARWQRVVEAIYDRFPDHWAAGVAFHH